MRATIGTMVTKAVEEAEKTGKEACVSASNGRWHVYADCQGHVNVYHFNTLMLAIYSDGQIIRSAVGHGSVSDQQGMNQVFRQLGLPLYYRRDSRGGGPRIEEL